ncbi:dihydrofolate reductase family protein [Nocardiopsis coralliicola]
MRRLIMTQNLTLDGAAEMIGDWFSPEDAASQDYLAGELARYGAAGESLLFGRRTFEDPRGFWPLQRDDRTGVTAALDSAAKYVVSSTLADAGWEHSAVLAGDPVGQVRALKEEGGGDLACIGSIRLAHALIAADLVDEYRLFTYPAVQGGGRRLFPEGRAIPRLELLDAAAFPSGVVRTRYRPL